MHKLAAPFIDLAWSVVASLGEAETVLAGAQNSGKPDQPTLDYARETLVTALERLLVLARRYTGTREFREPATGAPIIIFDASLCAALTDMADKLDACTDLGLGGSRLSATLRKWVAEHSPATATLLAAQCETAIRMTKKRVRA